MGKIKREKRINPSWLKKLFYFGIKNYQAQASTLFDVLNKVYDRRIAIEVDRIPPYSFVKSDKLTYQDLSTLVERFAGSIRKFGLKKGDKVIIFLSNRIEILLLFFGVIRAGGVAIPTNYMFRKKELEYILEHSGAHFLIYDNSTAEHTVNEMKPLPGITILNIDEELWKNMVESESLNTSPVILDKKDWKTPATILYTSGTTGFPKGAILTYENLSYLVKRLLLFAVPFLSFRKSLALHFQPLCHIMGIDLELMLLIGGVPHIFIHKFNPKIALETIEKKQVTMFAGVPTMYKMMAQEGSEKYDLTSIRLYGSAADVMPAELIEKFRKASKRKLLGIFPVKPIVLEEFGQVETAGFIAFRLSLPFIPYDKGSIGIKAPRVKIKIIDEKGKVVRFYHIGRQGEIYVGGKTVMAGYLDRKGIKKDTFKDGEFHATGDVVKRYLFFIYFAGREKDMLKVGGYSVFPAEVEKELRKHPSVEDAVVFGISHPVKGELPVAAIKKKDGENISEEEIEEWIKKRIAPYKAPRKVVFVDDFPQNLTMKVLKKELRLKFSHLAFKM